MKLFVFAIGAACAAAVPTLKLATSNTDFCTMSKSGSDIATSCDIQFGTSSFASLQGEVDALNTWRTEVDAWKTEMNAWKAGIENWKQGAMPDQLIKDINAESVDPYTCDASGEVYTTTGTDGGIVTHRGVTAMDLNNGGIETATSNQVLGSYYTVAHWISWKRTASNWRTLFRTTPDDHVILVRQSDGDLGMYSNRDGGYQGSGTKITTDGSWQFIVATGEASSPGSSSGTTTFYRASCTACDSPTFDNLGTAPRVASGQTMRYLGLSSQPPGYMARSLAFNKILDASEMQAVFKVTKPAGIGSTTYMPQGLQIDVDASAQAPYTCLASGETYTTTGTNGGIVTHNGVTAMDLNNGGLDTANSGIVFGDTYTVAHWISWKQSASNWRTLFRTTPDDHVILVRQSDGDLGMYSNRDGGFYGSGTSITTDGSWQFIVATGVASSSGSSSGTTTFYRASCTSCATPTFDNLGTAPRVASGQQNLHLGLSSQPPGYMARSLMFNQVLTEEQMVALFKFTKPAGI